MNKIKKAVIKVISGLKIPFNYGGLRVETLELIKKLNKERENIHSNAKKSKDYILFFGDSNIFGWNYLYKNSIPALLKKKINNKRIRK